MRSKYHYNTQAYDQLHALVGARTKTFSLNLAICDDSRLRDYTMQQLESTYTGVQVVPFWPYDSNVFQHVRQATPPGPHDAVFVSGLGDAIASGYQTQALFDTLNQSPDNWKAWFPYPIIFWTSTHTADILRHQAKDFWEWLQAIHRLES
jgi:hypothetical protein